MAERNNNLTICSLLDTEPAGRGGGGQVAAAATTIFCRSYSLEKSGPWRNPLGAPALGGTPATRSMRMTAPCPSRAQGTGTFIKI